MAPIILLQPSLDAPTRSSNLTSHRVGSDDETRLRDGPTRSAIPRYRPGRASPTNQLRQMLQPTHGHVLRIQAGELPNTIFNPKDIIETRLFFEGFPKNTRPITSHSPARPSPSLRNLETLLRLQGGVRRR